MGGEIDKAAGTVKEGLGKGVGDPELESEGKTQKVAGKVQDALETAKDAVKGVADAVKDKITEKDRSTDH